MPFFARGKTGLLWLFHAKKERNDTKEQNKTTNKEGLGPSEVAFWAHLTWPLRPPPKKNRQKHKEGLGPGEVAQRATSPDP